MRSRFQNWSILIAMMIIIGVIFWVIINTPRHGSTPQVGETVDSMVAKSKGYVKQRFTGGIGALMMSDSATGLPVINTVLLGSPAEIAGLRAGDVVLKVNDSPTQGQPLAQVVETMRGFAGGKVTLTVQRAGTNLTFVIKRSSWNAMGQTNIFAPATNPPVIKLAPNFKLVTNASGTN